jgi:hypothetical protein
MPHEFFDVVWMQISRPTASGENVVNRQQCVPFGLNTRLSSLSNVYAARTMLCVTEREVALGIPEWLEGRILVCPSAEHMWVLLQCLSRIMTETDESRRLIQLFSMDGRLANWDELAEWPGAKGNVIDLLSRKKHDYKHVGLIARMFAKLSEKAAILKFGVSNRIRDFGKEGDRATRYFRLRQLWYYILLCKFQQNRSARQLLLCTQGYMLVEMGNLKGSIFWGMCVRRKEGPLQNVAIGRNVMGNCLMKVRDKLLEDFDKESDDEEDAAEQCRSFSCSEGLNATRKTSSFGEMLMEDLELKIQGKQHKVDVLKESMVSGTSSKMSINNVNEQPSKFPLQTETGSAVRAVLDSVNGLKSIKNPKLHMHDSISPVGAITKTKLHMHDSVNSVGAIKKHSAIVKHSAGLITSDVKVTPRTVVLGTLSAVTMHKNVVKIKCESPSETGMDCD